MASPNSQLFPEVKHESSRGANEKRWEWLERNEWAQEKIAGDDTIWRLLDVYSREDPDRGYATLEPEVVCANIRSWGHRSLRLTLTSNAQPSRGT